MKESRTQKAKYNIVCSFLNQLVSLACGLIVPSLMIRAFGSETYGATTSITQFLAYITLLEGGVGGVARAALYKPLAEHDQERIKGILAEIRNFFRIIAFVFVGYAVVIGIFFHKISGYEQLDAVMTFGLVMAIAMSTLVQYYYGISYNILLQADQRLYILNLVKIITTILNTILIVILILNHSGIIAVKFVGSCVFLLRPIILGIYVKYRYGISINKCVKGNGTYLQQKWTGMGQHLAFFLHSNTDIVVLTIWSDLKTVAVYSVYNMVVTQVYNVVSSFGGGMEAAFGNILANNEKEVLRKSFDIYETFISAVAITFFSTAMVMIYPFVALYTSKVSDTNYLIPYVGELMILGQLLYALRMPYHNMVIAANHFAQTKKAAYGEAILNITFSILLVFRFGIIGVVIATVLGYLFRFIYYAVYLSQNILCRKIISFIKRQAINIILFVLLCLLGSRFISMFDINNYGGWALCAVVVFAMHCTITLLVNLVFYKNEISQIIARATRKK